MKYIKPSYENEAVNTSDVIMASAIVLEGGATLTETAEGAAQVGASALDVLGLR